MKEKITFLLFVTMAVLASSLFSQNIKFTYDAAGNRTGRDVVYLKETKVADTAFFSKKGVVDDVQIVISPNPNGGIFSVSLQNLRQDEPVKIFLHDLSGKLIFKRENCTAYTVVDIATRQNGMYILSVIVNNEKKTWKVIKE